MYRISRGTNGVRKTTLHVDSACEKPTLFENQTETFRIWYIQSDPEGDVPTRSSGPDGAENS